MLVVSALTTDVLAANTRRLRKVGADAPTFFSRTPVCADVKYANRHLCFDFEMPATTPNFLP